MCLLVCLCVNVLVCLCVCMKVTLKSHKDSCGDSDQIVSDVCRATWLCVKVCASMSFFSFYITCITIRLI